MKSDERVAWVTIAVLVAIAIAMSLSARLAHAEQPTLTDRIAAVIPSLASRKEESVDARELAEAETSDRPAEIWFMSIRPGMTPENNEFAAITKEWIDEWVASRSVASSETPTEE